jgi:hypothetical protein
MKKIEEMTNEELAELFEMVNSYYPTPRKGKTQIDMDRMLCFLRTGERKNPVYQSFVPLEITFFDDKSINELFKTCDFMKALYNEGRKRFLVGSEEDI